MLIGPPRSTSSRRCAEQGREKPRGQQHREGLAVYFRRRIAEALLDLGIDQDDVPGGVANDDGIQGRGNQGRNAG